MRRDPGGLQKAYVPRIMEKIGMEDPVSHAKLSVVLERLRPRLVLNMLEDPADSDKMEKLRRSAREYLGIELAHLGVIYRDELQGVALGSRIPIVRYKPGSILSRAVYRISDKIVSTPPAEAANERWPALTGTPESDDAGFQAAGSEAESDFQAMRRDLEDLLHSGALTTGDLVEAVRTQQLELATLRRENALLRARLLRAVREGAQA
jgi:flagellar biosynthesis protein FlhG